MDAVASNERVIEVYLGR
ncbi:MAG: hypothetical protein ACRDBL_05660 [Rhabdaerophilum sp.]